MPDKPVMHGRDHRAGGYDPIPVFGLTGHCVLAQTASVDISSVASYPILFDMIYDDVWNLNTITTLPVDLGLDINVGGGGAHSEITCLVDGIWSFDFSLGIPQDATVIGSCGLESVGEVRANFYGPAMGPAGASFGASEVLYLPATAHFYYGVDTVVAATASPYNTYGSIVAITRVA